MTLTMSSILRCFFRRASPSGCMLYDRVSFTVGVLPIKVASLVTDGGLKG